jgi:hypothetical protein
VDLFNWFFKQPVTEGEMDAAFDKAQEADLSIMSDQGLVGVMLNGDVAEHFPVPDLTVDISCPLTAYDQEGQRIFVTGTAGVETIDVSTDSNSVSTSVVTPGNEKIVSVFVQFARVLSNTRTDGNGNPVDFEVDEGFEFIVVQGAEAAPPATPPALLPDALLLGDITRTNGQTQIFDADIDMSRKESTFRLSTADFEIFTGTQEEALQQMLQELQNHVDNVGVAHPATAVDYDPNALPIPASWSAVDASTNVQDAIDGIVDDLVQATGVTGADLIGHNPTGINWADGTPLAATTVGGAIDEIIQDLADASGPDGAGRIGFDPASAPGLVATNVATAIEELATEKGNLAGGNSWSGTQTHAGLLDLDGNVNFGGASWIKHDPDHNFSDCDLTLQEYSEFYGARTATQTDDITLYSNTSAAAGIIEGTVILWTDNTNDSFVSSKFCIPFTKLSSSTPQIDNGSNFMVEIGGSGTVVMQGAAPTGASFSIVASSNTISLRVTHNSAGPTDRNVVAMWKVIDTALNH